MQTAQIDLPVELPLSTVAIVVDSETIAPQLRCEETEPGLFLIHLELANEGRRFAIPPHQWYFSFPIVDIHGVWHAEANREDVACLPLGSIGFLSQATSRSPVVSFFNHSDDNRLTLALADATREVEFKIGLSEEKAEIDCTLSRFGRGQVEESKKYFDTLRLDLRGGPFSRSVGDVSAWWASSQNMESAHIPDGAREAVLSTWYSMHQQVTPQLIEQECRLSYELGCRVVIVDDGWQTADNARGYGYCGDWEIDEGKMPDMAAHVRRVQEMGLQYMLWIAPLFMGYHTKNFARFATKYLYRDDRMEVGVLDARFSEVRGYLVETFVRLMLELDIDGYKIDFVDMVGGAPPEAYAAKGQGRDMQSIPQAMDALLVEMTSAFRKFKPDFLIEFRQSYVGPLMRKYGNMFRAGDCPNDFERNRYRTQSIRLLSGNTPAHADMFMWHPQDTPHNAARQMLASLFAVPQISVWLDKIPPAHRNTLRHWLGFWRAHQDVLLCGEWIPHQPHLGFPFIEARNEGKHVIAVYDDVVAKLENVTAHELFIINAGFRDRVVLECADDFAPLTATFFNLDGNCTGKQEIEFQRGVIALPVPTCGYALCRSKREL
jgi:alpha-galactosidase